MLEMFDELVSPPDVAWWIGRAGAALAAGFAVVGVALPRVQERILPKPTRTDVSDHVQFDMVLDDGRTIRCTDGSLIATIAVEGLDLEAMAVDDRKKWARERKMWLRALGEINVVNLIVVSMRRLHDHRAAEGAWDNPLLRALQDHWHSGFDRTFRNGHAVVLWIPGGTDKGRTLLGPAVDQTLKSFEDMGAVALDLGPVGRRSPLLSFWGSLLNPARQVSVAATHRGDAVQHVANMASMANPGHLDGVGKRLAEYLINGKVGFNDGGWSSKDRGVIEFRDGGQTYYGMAVSQTLLGAETSTGILQQLMAVEGEVAIVQWVNFYSEAKATEVLREKEKRDLRRHRSAVVQGEFLRAREMNDSRTEGHLVDHQMTAFVFAASKAELAVTVDAVQGAFRDFEISSRREGAEAECLYLSLFPPYLEWLRDTTVFTGNVCDTISFETPAQGLEACDWGDRPVTVMRTSRGSPFGFCWHENAGPLATGHTLFIGTTGGGKTVLMTFLSLCSLGYDDARVFLFDRHEGAYVAVKAFGGEYIQFRTGDGDGACTLNPLQMDLKDAGNRAFIVTWLRDHVMCTDNPLTEEAISRCIRRIAELPARDRDLNEVYANMDSNLPGIDRLARFCGEGEYADVFNGARDTLGDRQSRLVAFDATSFLDDEVLSAALIPYLVFRIREMAKANNSPWLLVLDEAPALWASEAMQAWTRKELQEARKSRGVVVLAIQRLGNLVESGLNDLVSLCANVIVLPAEDAGSEYTTLLSLTQEDLEAVRRRHPMVQSLNYFVLLKRKNFGSVVLDTDLSRRLDAGRRGHFLKLMESGRKPADEARALARAHPDRWQYRKMQAEKGAWPLIEGDQQ